MVIGKLIQSIFSSGGKKRVYTTGVYFDSTETRSNSRGKPESSKTIDTEITRADNEDDIDVTINDVMIDDVWVPSHMLDHNEGVPMLVRKPGMYDDLCNDDFEDVDSDGKVLEKIMLKSKRLPQFGDDNKYASNYIMINNERIKKKVPPMRRERTLDAIAKEHAQKMADKKKVFQIDTPYELHNELHCRALKEELEKPRLTYDKPNTSFDRVGMNIGKGTNLHNIHKYMMASLAERNNIEDKRFFHMGMATAEDENGFMYLCQIFGG